MRRIVLIPINCYLSAFSLYLSSVFAHHRRVYEQVITEHCAQQIRHVTLKKKNPRSYYKGLNEKSFRHCLCDFDGTLVAVPKSTECYWDVKSHPLKTLG